MEKQLITHDFSEEIKELAAKHKYVFGNFFLFGGYDEVAQIVGCDNPESEIYCEENGFDSPSDENTSWEEGTPSLSEWEVYEHHFVYGLGGIDLMVVRLA